MYRSEESVGGQQPVRMVDLETVRSVQPVGEPPTSSVYLYTHTRVTFSKGVVFSLCHQIMAGPSPGNINIRCI